MLISLILLLAAETAEQPPEVRLQEVPAYVGKTVSVSFVVRSLNTSSQALLILNSKKRFGEKGNFAVMIPREHEQEFAEADLANPQTALARFKNRPLLATGRIVKQGGNYVMIVSRHRDLRSEQNQG